MDDPHPRVFCGIIKKNSWKEKGISSAYHNGDDSHPGWTFDVDQARVILVHHGKLEIQRCYRTIRFVSLFHPFWWSARPVGRNRWSCNLFAAVIAPVSTVFLI